MNYDTPGIQQEGREIKITRKIEGITKERGESQSRPFRTKGLPSAEEIRRRLSYDPKTGTFTSLRTGAPAGGINGAGYHCITLKAFGKFLTHRLVWLCHHGEWPLFLLDHINGDKTDNRIENLREVTHAQNIQNSRVSKSSRTGARGVVLIGKRFYGRIRHDGKVYSLGGYRTKEEAMGAYNKAATELFGDYARLH